MMWGDVKADCLIVEVHSLCYQIHVNRCLGCCLCALSQDGDCCAGQLYGQYLVIETIGIKISAKLFPIMTRMPKSAIA